MTNKTFAMADENALEKMMNLSLDDYIRLKQIKHPDAVPQVSANSRSKFDRYCDETDDEDEEAENDKTILNGKTASSEENISHMDTDCFFDEGEDAASVSTVYANKQNNLEIKILNGAAINKWQNTNRKPVHQRLGQRNSNWKPLNYKRNQNFNGSGSNNNLNLMKFTVQNRLTTDYVNPWLATCNQINRAGSELAKCMKKSLIEEMKNLNPESAKPKYDMNIQKEISSLQKRTVFNNCPDGSLTSSDGPGVNVKVVQNATKVSLNQRFA